MDTRTGRIYQASEVVAMTAADRAFLKEMEPPPTAPQWDARQVKDNDPCPCASGKGFGSCCKARVWDGLAAKERERLALMLDAMELTREPA